MITKKEYIEKHPRSILSAELSANDWADDTQIEIIGGLIAPHNKASNLYKALQRSKNKEYEVGGHRKNGPDGWWIAVA